MSNDNVQSDPNVTLTIGATDKYASIGNAAYVMDLQGFDPVGWPLSKRTLVTSNISLSYKPIPINGFLYSIGAQNGNVMTVPLNNWYNPPYTQLYTQQNFSTSGGDGQIYTENTSDGFECSNLLNPSVLGNVNPNEEVVHLGGRRGMTVL